MSAIENYNNALVEINMNILDGYWDGQDHAGLPAARQSLTTALHNLAMLSPPRPAGAGRAKEEISTLRRDLTEVLGNYEKLGGAPSPAERALLVHASETRLGRASDRLNALTVAHRTYAGDER